MTVEEQVAERVRETNAARAQFLGLAFTATYFVAGVVDGVSMGTLRNHAFMVVQLLGSLATAAVVRWTSFGRSHAGVTFVVGICVVSAAGAAHLAQFGGLEGPWFYGSYTLPPILIAILLPFWARALGTFAGAGAFALVYWSCRPDLFTHPMAHVPVVYLVTVSCISIALGRYVHRLELSHMTDIVRLEAVTAHLEERLRADDRPPVRLRREIARQLHDDVAQLITGARLRLDGWSRGPAKHDALTRLGEVLDELSRRAHRMLDELRVPPTRETLTIELSRLQEDYAEMNLAVDVLVDDGADLETLPAAQRDALLAAAREGLTNAVRHGGASEATVSLFAHEDRLTLEVLDNGGGRADQVREGYGLLGIRERVEALGGKLRLSDYEAGLKLSVTTPRVGAA